MNRDVAPTRLRAVELANLAIVALTARRDSAVADPGLEVDALRRRTLLARITQVNKLGWPVSMKDDPEIRGGYTLEQCLRMVICILLLDAAIPPTLTMRLAREGDRTLMKAAVQGLVSDRQSAVSRPPDQLAVIRLGVLRENILGQMVTSVNLVDTQAATDWLVRETGHGRLVVLDLASAARSVWTWMLNNDLMYDSDRRRVVEGFG